MKVLWIAMLVLSLGCATATKLVDNLTSPGQKEATATIVDKALEGLPGPSGIDLGSAGIGGAVVSLLGLLGAIFRQRKETDQLWDASHRPVSGVTGPS